MGFKKLQEEFQAQVKRECLFEDREKEENDQVLYSEGAERTYRYWLLRLLFEIAGNLDSLVVSYRELVQMQKDKLQK